MVTLTKPHRTRASDLTPAWHVIDAEGKTLGRLSSEIAVLLQGKHKPVYVPYLITGDFVIVVNAGKVRVTGKKLEQKIYYRHSGYHGGLRQRTLSELLRKTPTRAIRQAVKGMLPKNTLGRRMLSRLKLYAESSHPHAAQVNARPKATEASAPQEAAAAEATQARPAEAASEPAKTKAKPRRRATTETRAKDTGDAGPTPKRRPRAKAADSDAEEA